MNTVQLAGAGRAAARAAEPAVPGGPLAGSALDAARATAAQLLDELDVGGAPRTADLLRVIELTRALLVELTLAART